MQTVVACDKTFCAVCCDKQNQRTGSFLSDWGPVVHGPPADSLGCPEHRQDRLTDRCWRRVGQPRPCDNADGPAEKRQGPWFGRTSCDDVVGNPSRVGSSGTVAEEPLTARSSSSRRLEAPPPRPRDNRSHAASDGWGTMTRAMSPPSAHRHWAAGRLPGHKDASPNLLTSE